MAKEPKTKSQSKARNDQVPTSSANVVDTEKPAPDEGVFEVECDDQTGEIRLVVKDEPGPIPEEQREIANGIYSAWGVLKLLKEQGVFEKNDTAFDEFRMRLCQVGRVGLAMKHVEIRQATDALQQIRKEISSRVGRNIKFRYLRTLAEWAAGGILVGLLVVGLATQADLTRVAGYGWAIVGSMVGAWISVAATRRTIVFEEMPNFLDSKIEPFVRLLFVGFLTAAFALLIDLGVITLKVAAVDFSAFREDIGVALLLGVIAGLSEKAISLRVIDEAEKVISPGQS